jgi:CheY-like chemotaxis protein/anti-sigma regulatory factor (Ser/Thr protein kinase)
MMSHEIRTPMHAAVGTASMLLETHLDERQRRYTETIVRAGESLGELINDVLDISRMDAQGAQLEAGDFELKTALLEVVQMFEPLARRAQLDFKHELADSTAIGVSGDKRRLQQILVNLIGNAIKFTERGEVRLTANASEVRAGFEIIVIVADTGIGIQSGQLERVFQPFEQADSGIARKYGGTGLGLAISKRLAETMGGRIDVASERGKGTTFTVVLQLEAARHERNSDAGRSNVVIEGAVPPGTRVLVVDDSELNREMAREMLERLRCVAETVSSGAEAIEACRTKEFDIVLMDCQMRDLDGYATTRQLRALDNAIARAPIVAVTANAFDDDRKRAFDAGMNDLLAKPFGIRELHRTLSRWLVAVGEPPTALDQAQSQPASASLYPHAMKHISSMLEGSLDEDVVDRVIEAFLQQWPRRLTALQKALEETDTQTLRQIVHTLEGAVPYFGIEKLNEALRTLQQQVRVANIAGAGAGLPELARLVAELEASRKRHHAPRSA